MKKLKLFLPFFCMFFFCGCKATVNVVVDTKLNVQESIQVTTEKENITGYFSSSEEVKENYVSLLNQYDHQYSLKVAYQDDEVVGTIQKKSNLKKDISGLESLFFQEIRKNEDSYELVFSDEIKNYFEPELEIDVDENDLLKKIEINIQFHNVVSDSNSDSYNSITNTYTWIIDKDNLDRNIEFTLTNEKRYDIIIPYLIHKYIGYIVLGLFLLGIILFILIIAHKSKRENEI
jgi:hypothetical protein